MSNTNDALNVKMKDTGRAYLLRKVKSIEMTSGVLSDLLDREITDPTDKMRVSAYRRGFEKAIYLLRYS